MPLSGIRIPIKKYARLDLMCDLIQNLSGKNADPQ